MEKAKTDKDTEKNKKKQLAVGSFFQPLPKRNKDGSTTQRIISKIPINNFKEPSIKCRAQTCMKCFKTPQALASHLNACQHYKTESSLKAAAAKSNLFPINSNSLEKSIVVSRQTNKV